MIYEIVIIFIEKKIPRVLKIYKFIIAYSYTKNFFNIKNIHDEQSYP